MRSTASSQSRLLSIPCRTLLTPDTLRERVASLLRDERRLRRAYVLREEAAGFRVERVDGSSSVRFTVRGLTRRINRVVLTFGAADAKVAGRLLDLLMPDLVDELTLEIFRRAHADKSAGMVISWPVELLAA
jgi:hypothetical protein